MKVKLIILALFSINICIAQNYNFGKISKEELQEQFNPQDSTANATYLYKYRKTYFLHHNNEFKLMTDVHERIKIYNKEDSDFATKEINLYEGNGRKESITGLKAYSYNFVDGKITETKLKKDGIFETELSKHYNQKKFTMPNIKKGTVIEYKYKIESPFYQNVDEFIFQHSIPIKKLEIKFEYPEYFGFKANAIGFLTIEKRQDTRQDKLTIESKSYDQRFGVKTGTNKDELEYTSNIDIYESNNIPALKNEPFVNNINNYRSLAKYELAYIKYPNSQIKEFSTSWEDVVKTIFDNSDFGDELKKSNYFKEDVNALLEGVNDPMEKAGLIFNYVKTKMKWNNYYGKYINVGVKKAYKEKVGNVAEINLMLTSMLRYAGINANPVLVSTRNNGIPLFPTIEGYNYIVCAIELLDNVILLDATSKYSTLNVLPVRALNWKGRIIRSHGSSALIDLYPKEMSSHTSFMSINLNDNTGIEGGIRNIYTAQKAMSYRSRYVDANKEEFIERLENKYDGIEISDYTVKNELEFSKPVIESYKVLVENQTEIIGDKMYISPLFFLTKEDNPFKLETREFPIDFGYPTKRVFRISINLPKNYNVETIPEAKVITLPDNLGSFKYNISANETSLQIIISSEINTSIIPSQYYKVIKEFYKQMREKENEKIILIKA
ncbi:transglutaminase domain-containing protein [uncultured Lacinutrix sp.]|uniref:transglutaminase domain-containing protein n=1 Tax=uncultured Lacinutrix sp. TaxID=574032 RepID=UPI00262307EA|nr:transglutaminase domain-containing protein [uncultured Lacinutrix sp.]